MSRVKSILVKQTITFDLPQETDRNSIKQFKSNFIMIYPILINLFSKSIFNMFILQICIC